MLLRTDRQKQLWVSRVLRPKLKWEKRHWELGSAKARSNGLGYVMIGIRRVSNGEV